MDLVSTCRDKLAYFRIKELKDVLTQLGLAKQGKKQDLVDRILSVLSDDQVSKSHGWGKKSYVGKEGVAKVIEDTYRKMQVQGATDLASKSNSGSDLNHLKPKEEANDSYQIDVKARCPCGNSLSTDSMIKCEDLRCQVWQHIGCVIIPDKLVDGASPEIPAQFYCEICRINRADPFWVTMGQPLLPLKLPPCGITSDGTNTVQSVEKTFQLSRADREMLQRAEFDLQVWCLLLNDKVPFRMQWPQYAELQVNGVPVRTTNRPGSQLLGINGRDDGPLITTCSREGINKICISRCDARVFCFGVRIARRRTVQQVLNLVPKEADGERFEDALARICRCIGGGNITDNADSDSDIEVVADSVTVNLRCPMSGSRMRVAGRFKPCIHMGCFDLDTFVELNERSRKWQCPICLKNYTLENIIIDPYFNRITTLMRNCGEDVAEIEVKPDGSWRTKNEGDGRDVAKWRLPDGSLRMATVPEVKPNLEILKQVKQEGMSEGHASLKLGIKKNSNGRWEVSKPDDMRAPSSGNHVLERYENHCPNVIPMSSSATGSYREGEDPSVNQEGGGHFDFSVNNGHEFDSLSLNLDSTYNVDRVPPAPSKDANVIILSDSEEENITMISPETVYEAGPGGAGISFPVNHSGVSERYNEDLGLRTNGTSCLGLFNSTVDDFETPLWPMHTCPQTGPGFPLFETEAAVPDDLVDAHNSVACAPMSGYSLASDGILGDTSHAGGLSACRSSAEMNESLVDNPLAYGGDDPSLQIFLPSRPAVVTPQADNDHNVMPNGTQSDDWISLSLAAGGGHDDSAPNNGLTLRRGFTEESGMESLANTASLLLGMSDTRAKKAASKKPPDSNFSLPHPPRQKARRMYLSIDSESDD